MVLIGVGPLRLGLAFFLAGAFELLIGVTDRACYSRGSKINGQNEQRLRWKYVTVNHKSPDLRRKSCLSARLAAKAVH